MIVPWFNSRKVTPLITCDLVRVNKVFCRIHNRHELGYPTLFFFLEVMTMICYSNYLLYLLIGGAWIILQSPYVFYRALKEKSWLNIPESIRNIPKASGYTSYLNGKAYLESKYFALTREYHAKAKY